MTLPETSLKNVVVDSSVYRIVDEPSPFDGGGMTVSTTYLHPQKATRGHAHERDELYIFCRCENVVMQIGDERVIPIPGTHVYVPGKRFHRVFNFSAETDCVFISIFRGDAARPFIVKSESGAM